MHINLSQPISQEQASVFPPHSPHSRDPGATSSVSLYIIRATRDAEPGASWRTRGPPLSGFLENSVRSDLFIDCGASMFSFCFSAPRPFLSSPNAHWLYTRQKNFKASDRSGMGGPLKNKIMLESLDRLFSFQVSEFRLKPSFASFPYLSAHISVF